MINFDYAKNAYANIGRPLGERVASVQQVQALKRDKKWGRRFRKYMAIRSEIEPLLAARRAEFEAQNGDLGQDEVIIIPPAARPPLPIPVDETWDSLSDKE